MQLPRRLSKKSSAHKWGPCCSHICRTVAVVLLVAVSSGQSSIITSATADNSLRDISSLGVPADNSINVSGDDSADAYRGTGGLLLPSSYSGNASSRKTIASCLDCFWRYTIYCAQGASGLCAHAVTTCSAGKIRYRVWFGTSANELRVVGSVCWGSSKPATRRDLDTQINQTALRYVPALQPGVAPRNSTFTSVPIIVWSGQRALFKPSPMLIAGHKIQITANAMWQWNWGDGSVQWTASPGAKYPARTLTHQFLRAGNYQVEVRTLWRATYYVAGIGTFAMPGDLIEQSASFPIQVKTGRAILVAK